MEAPSSSPATTAGRLSPASRCAQPPPPPFPNTSGAAAEASLPDPGADLAASSSAASASKLRSRRHPRHPHHNTAAPTHNPAAGFLPSGRPERIWAATACRRRAAREAKPRCCRPCGRTALPTAARAAARQIRRKGEAGDSGIPIFRDNEKTGREFAKTNMKNNSVEVLFA
uniref:Uncharacterized protein n=1 Tax=Oryza glumipatula TaxID=40148 RepID=A0A0E0AZA7_9ORYZ